MFKNSIKTEKSLTEELSFMDSPKKDKLDKIGDSPTFVAINVANNGVTNSDIQAKGMGINLFIDSHLGFQSFSKCSDSCMMGEVTDRPSYINKQPLKCALQYAANHESVGERVQRWKVFWLSVLTIQLPISVVYISLNTYMLILLQGNSFDNVSAGDIRTISYMILGVTSFESILFFSTVISVWLSWDTPELRSRHRPFVMHVLVGFGIGNIARWGIVLTLLLVNSVSSPELFYNLTYGFDYVRGMADGVVMTSFLLRLYIMYQVFVQHKERIVYWKSALAMTASIIIVHTPTAICYFTTANCQSWQEYGAKSVFYFALLALFVYLVWTTRHSRSLFCDWGTNIRLLIGTFTFFTASVIIRIFIENAIIISVFFCNGIMITCALLDNFGIVFVQVLWRRCRQDDETQKKTGDFCIGKAFDIFSNANKLQDLLVDEEMSPALVDVAEELHCEESVMFLTEVHAFKVKCSGTCESIQLLLLEMIIHSFFIPRVLNVSSQTLKSILDSFVTYQSSRTQESKAAFLKELYSCEDEIYVLLCASNLLKRFYERKDVIDKLATRKSLIHSGLVITYTQ
eukprot:CFRG4560T1